MERKKLKVHTMNECKFYSVYPADAVMDGYEARIKELETDFHELSIDFSLSNERIKELEVANTNLLDANVKLMNRIKELEDKASNLARAVTDAIELANMYRRKLEESKK